MNESLSAWDTALLWILARVRGLRPETALKYTKLRSAGGIEAVRKRMDRLAEKGFLAKSSLPKGQIFRLSHKGVRITGAPAAFANSPSGAIAAEMLSVSSFGWRNPDYMFLLNSERDVLMGDLTGGAELPKITGRFFLRSLHKGELHATQDETRLHYWLAEIRPAGDLAKRVSIIVENTNRVQVFSNLMKTSLFGITIAVPTRAVKVSLDRKSFPLPTEIHVVPELQILIS